MILYTIGEIMDNKIISVLGAGFSCIDIIKNGNKEELLLGGTAANVLSVLCQLGMQVTFLSASYDDALGIWLRDALMRRGIQVVNFVESHLPVPRVIELLDPDGKHTFKTVCPICGKGLVKTVLPTTSQVVHLNDEVKKVNLFYYDRISEGIKKIAALNHTGWNFYEPNSCRVYKTFRDVAQISNILKFAADRIPKPYIQSLLEDMQTSAVQLIIISNGEAGFRFSYRDSTGRLCDWIDVAAVAAMNIVDDSGAGDWLTASFLYAFLQEYPCFTEQLDGEKVRNMLESAKKVATFNCGFVGAQGVFKNEAALRKLNEYFGWNLRMINDSVCSFEGDCQYCKSYCHDE